MNKRIVQVFAVLRYDGGLCECVAECDSHASALQAIQYFMRDDSHGVYYRIELRYIVVEGCVQGVMEREQRLTDLHIADAMVRGEID